MARSSMAQNTIRICLFVKSRALACSLLALLFIGVPKTLYSQELLVHLRADSNIVVDDRNQVLSWSSVVDGKVFLSDTSRLGPTYAPQGMNGRPALLFANDGYLTGPSCFPVLKDYTLYIVMRWDEKAASNNLVSGTSHAVFLANSPYVKVLHGGDFTSQVTSSIPITGASIIRVRYRVSTGLAEVSINNEHGGESIIPPNSDSTLYIGSYARGNFLWGSIAEVLLFDGLPSDDTLLDLEAELHKRYQIERVADPVPPPITWTQVPQPYHFIPLGDSLRIQGFVRDTSVQTVEVVLDSNGIPLLQELCVVDSSRFISVNQRLYSGLHDYGVTVRVSRDGVPDSLVLVSDNIVCGVPLAIQGQSNSIFGDASIPQQPFARTFGSNYGKSKGDTVYKVSIATGNGGGANVGAWGLGLQQLLATVTNMPSCIINGGVGGTTIQQHLPDTRNRYDVNTIYGSWLYRLEKSGLRSHIRWLFWYQGESNSGIDNYPMLFDSLYRAWHQDLPNLEHVVVVQIRPGCGGSNHAQLRDDQRRLADTYRDVIVHTACGLPGHDGCHFSSVGYRTLADQLFQLQQAVDAGIEDPPARAPVPSQVVAGTGAQLVVVSTRHAINLYATAAEAKPLSSSFYFNGVEGLQPDSAWLVGSTIVLQCPSDLTPETVSYIPSKLDLVSGTVYGGPWITDEVGVGLLSFHKLPIVHTSVLFTLASDRHLPPRVCTRGASIPLPDQAYVEQVVSYSGSVATATKSVGSFTVPNTFAAGLYLLKISAGRETVYQRLLVVD